MSTYALVRYMGGERRYWRHSPSDPQGSWETDRGLATRWHKPDLARIQKAHLVHELALRAGYRDREEGLSGLLSIRVAKVTAKVPTPPVDLDALWEAAEGRLVGWHTLQIERIAGLGGFTSSVTMYVANVTTAAGVERVGEAESLSELLASLGQPTTTTGEP